MTVYSREQWGSTGAPGGYEIAGPVSEVYVHHFGSGIQPARSVDEAMARMRSAQAYHRSLGWGDIGYSWCVDYAGNVYEGRGWGRTGAHTYGYNSKGYGICGLFDSTVYPPSDEMIDAIAAVTLAGVELGRITAGPGVFAHRDKVPDTACCGDPMYMRLDDIRRLVAVGGVPEDGGEDKDKDMPALLCNIDGSIYGCFADGIWRMLGGAEFTHWSAKGVDQVAYTKDEWTTLRSWGRVA